MAVSRADFLTTHPRFADADTDTIDIHLSNAELDNDEDLCGDDYERMVYLCVAARLYDEPFAMDIGVPKTGKINPYEAEYRRLRRRKGQTRR